MNVTICTPIVASRVLCPNAPLHGRATRFVGAANQAAMTNKPRHQRPKETSPPN